MASLCMGGKVPSVLGLPSLERETQAHFLLSGLTLDFPKTEPLVRCVLNFPSCQTAAVAFL